MAVRRNPSHLAHKTSEEEADVSLGCCLTGQSCSATSKIDDVKFTGDAETRSGRKLVRLETELTVAWPSSRGLKIDSFLRDWGIIVGHRTRKGIIETRRPCSTQEFVPGRLRSKVGIFTNDPYRSFTLNSNWLEALLASVIYFLPHKCTLFTSTNPKDSSGNHVPFLRLLFSEYCTTELRS
ncbi:hypothetical protein DL96DRAFT_1556628 [Flagelloscypha sp. PMI_526]|nr:hypothetical protein DL96DRAFT_1556628 [Flagelloscypha sp. PMI_526]